MMDYNLFKTVFVNRILDYMPRDYADHSPELSRVKKVNKTKDGFRLVPSRYEEGVALPTIYLDDVYEDFCVDEDLDRVLSAAAHVLASYRGKVFPGGSPGDFISMKDSVVMNLINREMNRELLREIPHRDIMDLAIIYRIVVRSDESGIMSLIINDQVCEQMGVTEDELHELARVNTRRIFPARVIEDDESPMRIMTNDAVINGATTMLYKEDMRQLSEKMGGDLLILPSSIHEIFVISEEDADVGRMASMLAAGNGTVTEWADVLSNTIYRYSAEDGALRMCATCMEPAAKSVATEAEFI